MKKQHSGTSNKLLIFLSSKVKTVTVLLRNTLTKDRCAFKRKQNTNIKDPTAIYMIYLLSLITKLEGKIKSCKRKHKQ